ncbi:MAG: DUF721 domain-containing protein [Nitrospirota bacterium]|nr:MAG: DUF721 domain-containing protein [Nitrospirota bacterium]
MAFRYNMPIMGTFESIHSVIQDVAKGSALALKLSEVRLQQEWEGLVGQTIAKHSYPESIRYKKLYLVADNSIWLQQLLFLKATILEAIHSILPDLALTEIILRIGSIPQKRPASISTPLTSVRPILPSPFARALSQQLNNPDLQVLLSQTITKALAQNAPPTPEMT